MTVMQVLNIGGGVQSTCMAYMTMTGDLPTPDVAIFADTGWEPAEVYRTVWRLAEIVDYPIVIVRRGDIRQEHIDSANGGEKSVKQMPLFTPAAGPGSAGMLRRACSSEFKAVPITQEIRRLLGVGRGARVPPGTGAAQWYGITTDEMSRVRPSASYYIANWYPLVEKRMSRADCIAWMRDRDLAVPRKSSCVGCPYHSDSRWMEIRDHCPDEWREAVEFDRAIRGGIKGVYSDCYLHRSLMPLDKIDFDAQLEIQLTGVVRRECLGLCDI